MSYELANFKSLVRISVSFDPFPQKVVCGVQSCVGSGLPAVAHVDSYIYFFKYILTLSDGATSHFYVSVKWK